MPIPSLPPLDAFLHLSYPLPLSSPSSNEPETYLKGPRDVAYVASSLLFFVIAREVVMRLILSPIARRWVGTFLLECLECEKRTTKRARSVKSLGCRPTVSLLDRFCLICPSLPSTFQSPHAHTYLFFFLVHSPRSYSLGSRSLPVDAGGGGTLAERQSGSSAHVGDKEKRARTKAAVRFSEQGWSFLYYVVYWSFGMVSLHSISTRSWVAWGFGREEGGERDPKRVKTLRIWGNGLCLVSTPRLEIDEIAFSLSLSSCPPPPSSLLSSLTD